MLSVILQYIIYGSIFIVGLIILLLLRGRKHEPTVFTAKNRTEDVLSRIDRLLAERETIGMYSLQSKIIKIRNDVADLLVLAEGEVTDNRNVAFNDVLAYYKRADDRFDDVAPISKKEVLLKLLENTKEDMQSALSVLDKLDKRK